MKIAFISDIHANLPALEAVLKDLDQQMPNRIYCLGDLVGYHIWPEKTVRLIRNRNIQTLMGNHEEALRLSPSAPRTNSGITQRLISTESMDYLLSLPREIMTTIEVKQKLLNIWMVHGSPKAIDDYMTDTYTEQEVLDMMRERNADILLCGHTHIPFHRSIQDGERLRYVVNIGSVGKPKDGDTRASYVIFNLEEGNIFALSSDWKPEFRRVDYDVASSVLALKQSEFPQQYAQALAQGK